mmetsp:Transcript_1148/g.2742  ORF Transcript_1148/g.2742 Transcript_1148/m.2742 type:complete len:127 (-) Transcript_1148:80-460(-)
MGVFVRFSDWARFIALSGAFMLFATGLVCLFAGAELSIPVGAYSIALGALIIPFLYPVPYLKKLLLFFQIYWACGMFLMLASVFSFFQFSTHFSAGCICVAGCFYLIAWVIGEKPKTLDQVLGKRR